MKSTSLILSLSVFSLCLFVNVAKANTSNSEMATSAASSGEVSSASLLVRAKYKSYELCKKLGQPPATCRSITDRGVNFLERARGISREEIRAELSSLSKNYESKQEDVFHLCRSHENAAGLCAVVAENSELEWSSNLADQVQQSSLVASTEDIKNCVRAMMAENAGRLGLAVAEDPFKMHNARVPGSMVRKAIDYYTPLCDR